MAAAVEVLYFRSLAILATALLWGVSLWNGTVKALLLSAWHGRLTDGTPLRTDYTGIFPVDFLISLLVAFFFYGTNGYDFDYQYFLLDAYSTLQSAFIWLYIESAREQTKPWSIQNPIIWGMIWQAFGAAISLPLYFATHFNWLDQISVQPQFTPRGHSQAVLLSFTIGAIIPAIIGLLPTWIEPSTRSSRTHQNVLAVWQPDPLWVSMIQQLAAILLSRHTQPDEHKDYSWARGSFLLAATCSGAGHIYVMTTVLTSANCIHRLTRMYVPFPSRGPSNVTEILVRGPWLFLQYDLIIISLSSLSWAYLLLRRLRFDGAPTQFSLAVYLLLGTLTVGPGATVSSALFWREGQLQRLRGKMMVSGFEKP